ncbi:uncharacterized protein LOC134246344 [Saccostrea cucullata]|uniref:uncharacterized protein LOC134246344 n=1 Tax=Saccostrea cuccullata TaxID=36930 RepID=UPI002ED560C0
MLFLILTSTFLLMCTHSEGKDVYITRSNSPVCPPRAVCGDVFEFDRRRDDGTVEPERRHITNCFCNNTRSCNFNREHMIYQSRTQREVLCEPVDRLPTCRPGMIARRMYVDSMDFNDKSYYEVRCICPLNIVPSSRPRVKATVYRNLQFEGFDRIYNYKCNEQDVEEE